MKKQKMLAQAITLGLLLAAPCGAWAADLEWPIETKNHINENITGVDTLYVDGYAGVDQGVTITVENIGSAERNTFRSDMRGVIEASDSIFTSGLVVYGKDDDGNATGASVTAKNIYLYNYNNDGGFRLREGSSAKVDNIAGTGYVSVVEGSQLETKNIDVTGLVGVRESGSITVEGNINAGSNVQNEGGTLTVTGDVTTQAKFYVSDDGNTTNGNTTVKGTVSAKTVEINAGNTASVGSLQGLEGNNLENVNVKGTMIIADGILEVDALTNSGSIKQKADAAANSLKQLTVGTSFYNYKQLTVENFKISGSLQNYSELTVDKIGSADNSAVVNNSQNGTITIATDAYFNVGNNQGTIDVAGKAIITSGWNQLGTTADSVFKAKALEINAGSDITKGTLDVENLYVNKGFNIDTGDVKVKNVTVDNNALMQLRDAAKDVTFETTVLKDGSIQAYNNNKLTIEDLTSVKGKLQAWGQNKNEKTTINVTNLHINDGDELRVNNFSGDKSELNIANMELGENAAFYNVNRNNYDGGANGRGIAFTNLALEKLNSDGGLLYNDGEIAIAETSGESLSVYNSTLEDKVTIGNNALDELNVISSSSNIGSNVQDGMQAIADSVAVQKGNKVKYVYAQASEVYGDITGVTDNNGKLTVSDEYLNQYNQGISEMASIGLMTWRAENDDMNKRLGELRDSKGEHGLWARMTRGESKYGAQNIKNQYSRYELGYDEKLSVDKHWTVGAAVSYTDGSSTFTNGRGENKHTGLSLYGSYLSDSGSFVDLIAKYARLDNEFDVLGGAGKGDYDTNGYSLSAEYGKRFTKDNGLWIEPQAQLTYGYVGAVNYLTNNDVSVRQDGMDSLVGRVGFALGKDIKQGNVYLRASYLYDFDGETDVRFSKNGVTRSFEQDLGGGWWEVGVGTNLNLSDATHLYFDVEKTYGGNVATPWQWNAGVRWSF